MLLHLCSYRTISFKGINRDLIETNMEKSGCGSESKFRLLCALHCYNSSMKFLFQVFVRSEGDY